MDADDVACRDRFERQAGYLHRHPEVGVVGGATVLMQRDGRLVRTVHYPVEADEIRRALERRNVIVYPTSMMRTSLLRGVGWLPIRLRRGPGLRFVAAARRAHSAQ